MIARVGSHLSRRFAALGLLCLVIALGVTLVLLPIWREVEQTKDALIKERQIERRLYGQLTALQAAENAYSLPDLQPVLWTGTTVADAIARVQSRLSGLARESGVTLRSMTTLPSSSTGKHDASIFRVETEAPLDAVVNFLRAVEDTTPYLLVERADLRRLTRQGARVTQPIVFARFEVKALMATIVLEAQQ